MTDPASTALTIHIDGASRGNPGDAGFGVRVSGPEGKPVADIYGFLGRATNNFAEYQALLHGLRFALAEGVHRLRVFSDSELVVRQIVGRYRVKHPDLVPLHREAKDLLRRFEHVSVAHVRREENRPADMLANRAIDEKPQQPVELRATENRRS